MKTRASRLFARMTTLLIVFAIAFAPLPMVERAHAQIPVTITSNFDPIQDLFDMIPWLIGKTAIQSMTRSMVNWINSGYEGEPAFSQNLTRDLRQLGDAVAADFEARVVSATLDSPFAAPIAKDAVAAYYLATSEDLFEERLRYTLADFTAYSADFIRGDFNRGGFDAWFATTRHCGNDPACVSFATREELARKMSEHVRAYLTERTEGRGFLAWRGKCKEEVAATSLSDEKRCIEYDVLTPGSVVESQLENAIGSPIDQLELADSVNEIVSAAVMQMVGGILGGGGLAGQSVPRAGGTGRPIDNATNSGAGIGVGFEIIVDSERDKALDYKEAWTELRALAEEAEESCESTSGLVGFARLADIRKIIERANAAIAKADAALVSIDEILALLEGNDESTLFSGTQTASSQRAWDLYQNLLKENALITSKEQADAVIARSDIEGSGSIYLKLQGYIEACD